MVISACQDPGNAAAAVSALLERPAAVLPDQQSLRKACHAARMREAKADLRAVSEAEYVQAIDRWLDGGLWAGANWYFTSGRGLVLRLVERGNALTEDGVAIVTREPIRLCELPAGTRTSRRVEARALAAIAVRGDAGWYYGERRRPDRPQLRWIAGDYVQGV